MSQLGSGFVRKARRTFYTYIDRYLSKHIAYERYIKIHDPFLDLRVECLK